MDSYQHYASVDSYDFLYPSVYSADYYRRAHHYVVSSCILDYLKHSPANHHVNGSYNQCHYGRDVDYTYIGE